MSCRRAEGTKRMFQSCFNDVSLSHHGNETAIFAKYRRNERLKTFRNMLRSGGILGSMLQAPGCCAGLREGEGAARPRGRRTLAYEEPATMAALRAASVLPGPGPADSFSRSSAVKVIALSVRVVGTAKPILRESSASFNRMLTSC
jgi:hypothetical protein